MSPNDNGNRGRSGRRSRRRSVDRGSDVGVRTVITATTNSTGDAGGYVGADTAERIKSDANAAEAGSAVDEELMKVEGVDKSYYEPEPNETPVASGTPTRRTFAAGISSFLSKRVPSFGRRSAPASPGDRSVCSTGGATHSSLGQNGSSVMSTSSATGSVNRDTPDIATPGDSTENKDTPVDRNAEDERGYRYDVAEAAPSARGRHRRDDTDQKRQRPENGGADGASAGGGRGFGKTIMPRAQPDYTAGASWRDDDQEVGYESARAATSLTSASYRSRGGSFTSGAATVGAKRFRGFSTSISSLFLDESLVCGACSCFGLVLSQRTEHLLNLRNITHGVTKRAGGKEGGYRSPSRVVMWCFILSVIAIATTYVVFGFGSTDSGGSFLSGVDYDFDQYDDYTALGDDDEALNEVDRYYYDDYVYARQDDYYNNEADDDYNNAADDGDDAGAGDDDAGAADDAAGDDDDAQADDENEQEDDDEKQEEDEEADEDEDGGEERRMMTKRRPQRRESKGRSDFFYSCGESRHRALGIVKVKDYRECLWDPTYRLIVREWNGRNMDDAHAGQRLLEEEDLEEEDAEEEDAEDAADDDQAVKSKRRLTDDVGGFIRTIICLIFLCVLGFVGRRRRMRTRFSIIRARAQEDNIRIVANGSLTASASVASPATALVDDGRIEDKYDGACSHTLCGCYPADPPSNTDDYEIEDGQIRSAFSSSFDQAGGQPPARRRKHGDCMSLIFECLMASCCGFLCRVWCQCLSVCALAQEAREARLLVHPRFQRIDLLTHQPFVDYYGSILALRKKWMGFRRSLPKNTWEITMQFQALSRLSRYILIFFLVSSIIIVITEKFNPRANFEWGDVFVLLATFLQSFVVIFIVHFVFHKSDLSLDAVIKFFGAGFLIATPSCFIFEQLAMNVLVYIPYGILKLIGGESFVQWVIGHYHVLWPITEIASAYLVAGTVEELCKYYTFRAVEHPDLLFLTGLARKTKGGEGGGKAHYPYSTHNVSRSRSFESVFTESSLSRSRKGGQYRGGKEESIMSAYSNDSAFDEEPEIRTHRQRAAAVTTAMVGTAIGLACAENFLYVFLFGTGNTKEEFIILLARSLFPVHALCGAIQSIGVIKKFIEKPGTGVVRIGVGRIVFPAILLHGTFDAILATVNVYVETKTEEYKQAHNGRVGKEPPYNAPLVNSFAWISLMSVMILGFVWFAVENRRQKNRLRDLEEDFLPEEEADTTGDEKHETSDAVSATTGEESGPHSYVSPEPRTSPSASETRRAAELL